MRERMFKPTPRFKSLEELNGWLLDQSIAYAKKQTHPEQKDHTVWEMFESERSSLIAYRGRFDGFHSVPAAVSKTCLIRFDTNKYSVSASAVGRPVDVHAYADRIIIKQDGLNIAEHTRSFGRGKTIYDPIYSLRHYVPVLARKPNSDLKEWRFKERCTVQRLGAASLQSRGRRLGKYANIYRVQTMVPPLPLAAAVDWSARLRASADGCHSQCCTD